VAQKKLIVITGPTASGKTSLSIKLAKKLDCDIISADSRQIYKRLSIGTAKPSKDEQEGVTHHFIDFLEPTESYSAGQYERDVLSFLDTYYQSHSCAILVGGSGLYIDAIIRGFDNLPSAPAHIREKWNQLHAEKGLEYLQNQLREKDPTYYQTVDTQNPHRIIRALEAMEVSGKTFSELRNRSFVERTFDVIPILINPPRETLYNRINKRVDTMVESGLIDEAKELESIKHVNALNTVGYKEFYNDDSTENSIEKVKQHTRNFAKRQTTWFKKYADFETFDSNEFDPVWRHLSTRLSV